jgi:hypothetical protein
MQNALLAEVKGSCHRSKYPSMRQTLTVHLQITHHQHPQGLSPETWTFKKNGFSIFAHATFSFDELKTKPVAKTTGDI